MSQIIFWRPVLSFDGKLPYASAIFVPTLDDILKFVNKKQFRCLISDNNVFSGYHMCIIDKVNDFPLPVFSKQTQLYVATLLTPWKNSLNEGTINIM